ncbi:MAG: polysaccharide biosynthesis protein [Methanoregula sp.]|jgi:FlaA1/EpsC-like NDP-sugar epimerase|nr:polysaccharide biosynthesis protein [Methanoregula sp.]
MNDRKNILIVGAGEAGELLKKDIEKNYPRCKVIGFVDDQKKVSRPTLGSINDLEKINKIYKVDEIIIAIPSADGALIRQILLNCAKNKTPIKIVPRSQRVIKLSDVKYSEIQNIEPEDFLGRPFFKSNVNLLVDYYRNKTILITGGAGSIGSEIVNQLLDLDIKKIIIYDNSEYLIFLLDQKLRERGIPKNKYKLIIGNILNKVKLNSTIKKERPDIIFHAAAYKHVYLMENNIDEAIENNIVGSKNVIDTAIKNKIKNFVFISTDKVVHPKSIMGATKKISEYYIKNIAENNAVKFSIVRFGNVINSNGSVLPIFERQIKERKIITVTHKDVRRFFMSIREAAQLVINSLTLDGGGEIFILNMGEIISIYEMALCLIRSKNMLPGKDVAIKIIGLKKGEKLIEELFTDVEKNNLVKTDIQNIFLLKNFEKSDFDINIVLGQLDKLASQAYSQKKLRAYLKKIFPSLET